MTHGLGQLEQNTGQWTGVVEVLDDHTFEDIRERTQHIFVGGQNVNAFHVEVYIYLNVFSKNYSISSSLKENSNSMMEKLN